MHNLIDAMRQLIRNRAVHGVALALLCASALDVPVSRADPGDFQAMPGLWKTQTQVTRHGHPGKTTIHWHCVGDDENPWVEFANLTVPGAQCKRSDEQRSSTTLAWTLSCSGHRSLHAHGSVQFDSAEHYTASVVSKNHRELVHVEGQRRAACTDPSD